MNNIFLITLFFSTTTAGVPKAYTGYAVCLQHHELEKALRAIIDERLVKFHTTFYRDVSEWMSYLENFTSSKFSEHFSSISEELKQHRHHNRAVLNDIKSSCVHKREITLPDYVKHSETLPTKTGDLMAEAEAFRRRYFTETTTQTTTTTTTGTTTPIEIKPVTDKTPHGAEFVASDYDDFGESIPFFSSTESTTPLAILRSPFPRNLTAEALAEKAIMDSFRKLWNISS